MEFRPVHYNSDKFVTVANTPLNIPLGRGAHGISVANLDATHVLQVSLDNGTTFFSIPFATSFSLWTMDGIHFTRLWVQSTQPAHAFSIVTKEG